MPETSAKEDLSRRTQEIAPKIKAGLKKLGRSIEVQGGIQTAIEARGVRQAAQARPEQCSYLRESFQIPRRSREGPTRYPRGPDE